MGEETDEVNNRYDSPLSYWHILYAVVFVAVVAFGYLCLPAIVNALQLFINWFNWFCLVLSYLCLAFVSVSVLIFLFYVSFWKTTGKSKPKLYDQSPLESPAVSALSSDYFGLTESGNYGNNNNNNYNNWRYKETTVPAFRAVEESNCNYDRVVAEVTSKRYRRTRTEKKTGNARTKMEYRRMESERMTTLHTMNGLTSEEIRMTVDTFISENINTAAAPHWQNGGGVNQWQNGVVFDQWQNGGVVDQWQNGIPQLQNGVVDQWQTGLPQWQNGVVDQWQNGVVDQWQNRIPQLQNGVVDQWQTCLPQLQNGVVDQWQTGLPQLQNGDVQWQGSRDDGTGRRRRHRSRSHRLVGGSGSTGSGSGS